jgi:hypothetical protein
VAILLPPEPALCVLVMIAMHPLRPSVLIEPKELERIPILAVPVVSAEPPSRLLWWAQCVFFAGALAMLAYSGLRLTETDSREQRSRQRSSPPAS